MQHLRCATRAAAFIAVVLISLPVAPALAHSALTGSAPDDGARLDAPPDEVTVSYSEPPTTESRFAVLDGCGRDVTGNVEILNQTIDATVEGGEPGRWKVEWSVISAVDGHLTRDDVSFRVRGERDCSRAMAEPVPDDDGEAPASSIPVLPIVAATLVIVGIAAAIRLGARNDKTTE